MKKILVSFLFFVMLISCQDKKSTPHFLDLEEQVQKKRNFVGNELKLDFEKDLEELGIYNLPEIVETKDNFVLAENSELIIKHLSKSDLTVINSFEIPKGRGPKELEFIMTFDTSEDLIAVADNRLMKVILLDHEGNLVNEFTTDRSPIRLNLTSNRDLNLKYSLYFGEMDTTFMYNLTEIGDVNYPFKKENYKDIHPFAVTGDIKTVADTLYYVGTYEPYIKKYVNGERIFSRATIDNYDSSLNYITMISKESSSTSLSPEAIISSIDFDVKEGLMYVVPHSNGDNDFSFIDVYDSNEGSYIKSYRTIDIAGKVNVYEDERTILTIEKVGELGRLVFRKYSY